MITDIATYKSKLEQLKQDYASHVELPSFSSLENSFFEGANAYEGYQRGWGLQFSSRSKNFANVVDQIRRDELYKFGLKAAEGLTVVSEENRMNLFLITTKFLNQIDPGDWIEFGSYKGGNAIFLAIISKVLGLDNKIFACDTFEGMPETHGKLDLHNKGDFTDANYDLLKQYKDDLGLDNLILTKGLFSESLKRDELKNLTFSFAHIDCDIYDACSDAFQYISHRMVQKGYLVFDDACVSSCIGATRFVEKVIIRDSGLNSEQIWPHFVFRVSK